MTKVRLGHEPDKVVDVDNAEIIDLRNLGVKVEEVKEQASETSSDKKGSK